MEPIDELAEEVEAKKRDHKYSVIDLVENYNVELHPSMIDEEGRPDEGVEILANLLCENTDKSCFFIKAAKNTGGTIQDHIAEYNQILKDYYLQLRYQYSEEERECGFIVLFDQTRLVKYRRNGKIKVGYKKYRLATVKKQALKARDQLTNGGPSDADEIAKSESKRGRGWTHGAQPQRI